MKQSTVIRGSKLDDIPCVSQIDRESFGENCYPLFVLRQALDVFGDLFLVAERCDRIVGYTLGALQSDRSNAWILALAVAVEYRRHGIAAMLTDRLLHKLMQSGVRHVFLTVDPNNQSAYVLYKKIGFCELQRSDDYFGQGEARILMRKDF